MNEGHLEQVDNFYGWKVLLQNMVSSLEAESGMFVLWLYRLAVKAMVRAVSYKVLTDNYVSVENAFMAREGWNFEGGNERAGSCRQWHQ